jgi:Pleckstrin homology domain
MNRDLTIGFAGGSWSRHSRLQECTIFAESQTAAPSPYSRLSSLSVHTGTDVEIHGSLYAKFRRNSTFTNYQVVLTSRTLLIYEHVARSTRGIGHARIHHSQVKSIDLRHCYVYSGQMVQSELLRTTSLDPHLGYGVTPKLFRDGWTSVDDDLSYASPSISDLAIFLRLIEDVRLLFGRENGSLCFDRRRINTHMWGKIIKWRAWGYQGISLCLWLVVVSSGIYGLWHWDRRLIGMPARSARNSMSFRDDCSLVC